MLLLAACGGGENSSNSNAEGASAANTPTQTTESEEAIGDTAEKIANDASDAASDMAENVGAAIENAAADVNDAVETVAVSAQQDATSAYASLTGDAAKGRRVFAKCMACHAVQEGQNRVGPSLYNIIGSEAGSVEGFNYTDANANSGIVWTEEIMFAYLENPQEYIPGTRMIFPGLPSEQDRADVIAYLKSVSE